MKGIIIRKGEQYYTYLGSIFAAIDHAQRDYHWLITGQECYPQTEAYAELLSQDPCWMTGEELSKMIETEDFQWIWGCLSGFPKNVTKEEVLRYDLPLADGNETIWQNPVSIQHPLAAIEIIAWDSTCTTIISRDDAIIDKLIAAKPWAENLENYNSSMKE